MSMIMRLRCQLADLRGRGVYAGWPNENRAIFIHLPKTAGTSVSQALGLPASRHVPAKDYIIANEAKFRKYFKFAFVRNPYDRLVSSYTFLKDGGMNNDDARFAAANVQPYESFEHFVIEGLARSLEIQSWVHFRQQITFVCDEEGRNKMDFTGRFERLDEDFAHIAKRLGKPVALPVTNKSSRGDYRSEYNQKTIEIVRRVYAADFDAFGYGLD